MLFQAAEKKRYQSGPSPESDGNAGWLSGWWGWYGSSGGSTIGQSLPPDVVNEQPQTPGKRQREDNFKEKDMSDSLIGKH